MTTLTFVGAKFRRLASKEKMAGWISGLTQVLKVEWQVKAPLLSHQNIPTSQLYPKLSHCYMGNTHKRI